MIKIEILIVKKRTKRFTDLNTLSILNKIFFSSFIKTIKISCISFAIYVCLIIKIYSAD